MRGYMFRNRWFALLFVALTLAGVTRLVGTEEDHGALTEATDTLVAQKNAVHAMSGQGTATGEESDPIVEYISDEELIDPALGEDPTPVDETAPPAAEAVSPEDVVIVSQGPAASGPPAIETPPQTID